MAVNNTTFTLNVHFPKKDTVLTTGVDQSAINPNEVAIFIPTFAVDRPQWFVGQLKSMFDYGLTNMRQGWTSISAGVAAPESGFAIDAADEPLATLYIIIGANIRDKQQTHFFDRTFKRLIERLLEEWKDGLS